MTPLPVAPAYQLTQCPQDQRWLVEELWSEEAVGIIGGEPKVGKTFLGLDLAVAVASGTRCLRQYPVRRRGRVLLYAAEDAPYVVRQRLEGICAAAEVALDTLDLQVITAPSLRLDLQEDQARLTDTVAELQPKLLLLDPFVRLHRIDENASGDVAPILAYLRGLQRQYHVAVTVVHHAKKGAGRTRAGQALRGSSEFHAWGDSNLYLRRTGEQLHLCAEHRAAPGIEKLPLRLEASEPVLALQVDTSRPEPDDEAPITGDERIRNILKQATGPLSHSQLRQACGIRTATFCRLLTQLVDRQVVAKSNQGYHLRNGCAPFPFPIPDTPRSTRETETGNHPSLPCNQEPKSPGKTESGNAGTQPEEG